MASSIDVEELIARPLDVITRLRVELKARDAGTDNNTNSGGGEETALLAGAISEALCSGTSPALDQVPLLSREALAEVRCPMCVGAGGEKGIRTRESRVSFTGEGVVVCERFGTNSVVKSIVARGPS